MGYGENLQNVRAGLAEMSRVGRRLAGLVAEEIGHPVTTTVPSEYWVPRTRHIRGDLWLSWRPQVSQPVPGLRIQCDREGLYFVINSEVNRNPKGFSSRALELVRGRSPRGGASSSRASRDGRFLPMLPDDSNASFHAGHAVEVDELSSVAALEDVVRWFVREARPILQLFLDDPGPLPENGSSQRTKTWPSWRGSSSPRRGTQRTLIWNNGEPARSSRDFLEQDRLPSLTKEVMRKIYSTRYGSPGPQSILSTTIRDADDAEWERFLKSIDILLWGEQPVEQRIDRVSRRKRPWV